MVPFSFAGHDFLASPDGALHWPAETRCWSPTCTSKRPAGSRASASSCRPTISHATLAALERDVDRSGVTSSTASATRSTTASAATACPPRRATCCVSITARIDWVWIVGNHDAGFVDHCGGRLVEEVDVDGIVLRHEAVRPTRARNVGPLPPQAAASR